MRISQLCFLMVFFSIQPLGAQQAAETLLPTEVLLQKVNKHGFSISPNGKYFAYVESFDTHDDLLIVDIDEYKLYKNLEAIKYSVDNVYWLSNERILFESMGDIYAINIDGSNEVKLVSKKVEINFFSFFGLSRVSNFSSIINTFAGSNSEILIETFDHNNLASIQTVNIHTGQKSTKLHAKKYNMNKWFTNVMGDVKVGVSIKEVGMDYQIFDNELKEWTQFYLNIEGKKYPLQIRPETYLLSSIRFLGFGLDPNIIYVTSNVISDKSQLLEYDISLEKVTRVLVDDVNCDVADRRGEGLSLIFDYNKRNLAGVKYDGIKPQFLWFTQKFADVHAELNKRYPFFINEIIDQDADQNRFLVRQYNDYSEGNVGVFDLDADSYAVMFKFNDELDNFPKGKTKSYIATMRDNFKIPCYINLPAGYKKGDKPPLVVIPHGGPWARDYWGLDIFSQYFASRGYVTLRVNFRGSTGFGKEHVMAGIKNIDKIMIDDIVDATGDVVQRLGLDDKNVFIFGHSYGGYATYMSGLKYPDIFKAGVAASAPTDINSWMKIQKKLKNDFTYIFWNQALGSKNSAYLNEISPITYAKKIDIPLLIFHGMRDDVIPVSQAEKMIKKMNKKKKDVKLEIFGTQGHSFEDIEVLGYILETSHEFFQRNSKN